MRVNRASDRLLKKRGVLLSGTTAASVLGGLGTEKAASGSRHETDNDRLGPSACTGRFWVDVTGRGRVLRSPDRPLGHGMTE